jgi:exodeoxyribonuclease VII large subunit
LIKISAIAMIIGRTIYTVSLLSREVKRLLETSYANIQVEGEISSLSRPASGHQYFSIKDENCQLRCVFFKNNARLCPVKLTEGMQVIISARISLYEQRGDFQLIVQSFVESGEGLLRKGFEQLKSQLSAEGLFDLTAKKLLPAMPRRVGIITSETGAAVHDIISVFKRRFPAIKLLIYPALVQGELAAESLVTALKLADTRKEVDVLIIGRGGGSLEDLWPFNEEAVARAIFHCSIPLVSAVGHESDITISDLVADIRAATPTAAAELLSPDKQKLSKAVVSLQNRLQHLISRKTENASQQFDHMQSRLGSFEKRTEQERYRYENAAGRFFHISNSVLRERYYKLSSLTGRIHRPDRILEQQTQHCLMLHKRLTMATQKQLVTAGYAYATQRQGLARQQPSNQLKSNSIYFSGISKRLWNRIPQLLQHKRNLLETQVYALHTLSPLQTLSRGFATLQTPDEKTIVSSVMQVQKGDAIQANLKDGHLQCKITNIYRDKND